MPIHRFFVLGVALALATARAEEPMPIASIAGRYLAAETYCEEGKWGIRSAPDHGFSQVAFTGCAHRDGRFKYVEHVDQPRKVVNWSDSQTFYRYSEYGSIYKEYALDDPYLFSLYGYRREAGPALHSRLFAWDSGRLAGIDLARSLRSYKASSALSTPQYSVFERFNDDRHSSGERLWVSIKDKSIVRYEGVHDRAVLRFVEITSQEIDRPLARADLSQDVPFAARYSMQSNPSAFVAGLFAAAGVIGVLGWGWLFARTQRLEDVLRKRRRLWRLQLWLFAVTVVVFALLAAFALSGRDSGHPPAIVGVFLLAGCCGIAFALLAFFTSTSYLVQPLFKARRTRNNGG